MRFFLAVIVGGLLLTPSANAATPRATDTRVERAIVRQAATKDINIGIRQEEFAGLYPQPSVHVVSADCAPNSGRRSRFRCAVKYAYDDFQYGSGFAYVGVRVKVIRHYWCCGPSVVEYIVRLNGSIIGVLDA